MAPTANTTPRQSQGSASTENAPPRKPGRPKGSVRRDGRGRPKRNGNKEKSVTKMIDGKLMRRALGVPKRIMTGKPGRPRKEYVWVEVTKKET